MAGKISNQIILNGLVLYLDAANTKSYTGTGTRWNDLTVNGNNNILTNGPVFTTQNGGGIIYDGINDYAAGLTSLSTQISSAITIITWARITNFNLRAPLYTKFDDVAGAKYKLEVGSISGLWNRTMRWYAVGSNNPNNSSDYRGTIPLNDNQIYMFTITYNNLTGVNVMYYNNNVMPGFQAGNNLVGSDWAQKNINYVLGSFLPYFPSTTSQIRQYNLLIYNRPLSASEVIQNYNSMKGRFGL